ncbi:MAG: hypothetical protein GY855_06750 [candidate division Zixibacteria bacterium]|nr:hypothetical protein [candidate division Zixibacteria bacterium]
MRIFTPENVEKISNCLKAVEVNDLKDHYRLIINNAEENRRISVDLYPQAQLGETIKGPMISVYTRESHLQLHNCSGFVLSEELGEVTFVAESGNKISGIVVEIGAACSLYANVDRKLISSDFTKLGVEAVLSGVALSLAESILNDNPTEDE